MKIATMKCCVAFALASSLSGCVTMQSLEANPRDDVRYRVGSEVTRQDTSGNTDVLTQDGWKSGALAETKMPRQKVWYISLQESGIKAWRYGFLSEENYRYIDPLSPIVEASAFSATGWATYLVKGDGANDFIVKRANFTKNADPEVLGLLEGYRREWRFTPVGRPTMAAYGYHLTSKGLVLSRTPSAFTYFPSGNPRATLLPEDWQLAWRQKGDIENSRLLIVKKLTPKGFEPGRHQIGFFDLDKNRMLPTVFEMTFIPNSEDAQFGNRFFLFDTPRGPITITLEDGIKQVVVRNVKTGEIRIAFQRDAGIARIKAEQTNTGRIAVEAAVGFSDQKIYDAEDFLYSGRTTPP
ncbi:hypothetical protein [Hydrogenophaga sp.]|uniref:hypothetical protein n=1 Tax=Hydrogenophaga sp. TaxID=1904254 RepID=UPI003BB10297